MLTCGTVTVLQRVRFFKLLRRVNGRGEPANMARTKQTARRSTGGPAPLKSLSLELEPTIPGPDVTVATIPPSKLLVSGVTATRSTTASSRNTRLVASRDDGHAHVSFSLASLGSLTPTLQWCSICHNGGKLMLCSTCDRGVCLDSCLPTNIPANARKAVFTCPDCWRRNKETRGEPYKVGI
jgi:hypothetical protein